LEILSWGRAADARFDSGAPSSPSTRQTAIVAATLVTPKAIHAVSEEAPVRTRMKHARPANTMPAPTPA
jgi:hypothetical protein